MSNHWDKNLSESEGKTSLEFRLPQLITWERALTSASVLESVKKKELFVHLHLKVSRKSGLLGFKYRPDDLNKTQTCIQ